MRSKINLKSELIKSAIVLSSGTVLAQAISYLLTPFITRLYSPEDFGEFGIIMRIVAFLAVIGAARYEHAIPLPKKNEHAFHIYRLSLRILMWTVGLTLLAGGIFWLFKSESNNLLFYIVTISAITGFTVFISIGRHWAIRMKWFKNISISTLIASATTNTAKLLAGIAGLGVIGLVISTLLGVIVGSLVFVFDAFGIYKRNNKKSKLRRAVVARQYREFPKVNLPHSLIDASRELIIAFFLTLYLSTSLFGSYDHSFRMLKIPLLLIGVAVGQVLYNKISADFAQKKVIYPLLKRSVILLTLIGIIPFTVIYIWGAPIFAFVFGEEWRLSGQIAAVLSPWLMANFVASSISMVPAIIGKLKWFFWIGIVTTIMQLSFFAMFPELMEILRITEIGVFEIISWIMFVLFWGSTIWLLRIVKGLDHSNG
ncbi:lipopolysaccharide biosynthesis protein [Brumimicrobium glaciale]|uniref:Lipopolysaccharide biosynthesis protein n=1 Tax=Brumimicrobium glaciale TaxID=200475 RepID=A0A4Q4KMU3_9FLAO|nr:lipopolysaccharide biosynthesis protein [Brumimicrobium glaciale]RYM34743.1 lipopolysaccharide biosynthesis protein [Brumimicrobium glaciale]